MNFVSARILSEQDSDKQQELMQQARAGVERGFAEASGQLSMLSRFSRSESTRVEILTNEGDRILVDLFKSQSADQQTRLQQSEDGNSFSRILLLCWMLWYSRLNSSEVLKV